MSQFGVFARLMTSNHQAVTADRSVDGRIPLTSPSLGSFVGLRSQLPVGVSIGNPRGIQKSFAEMLTESRPTIFVRRVATSSFVPAVSKRHRGRLPRWHFRGRTESHFMFVTLPVARLARERLNVTLESYNAGISSPLRGNSRPDTHCSTSWTRQAKVRLWETADESG